ncbi:MAG TPA: glutathione S-transferase family protein [Noviherbaspirillum sp.]|uniref:glutathione S-transferase n=1 Tax=Noviherbaspirillum sp. TaxID=1926288 RepID=UPI002DDDAFC3|nr:glutathione S-transferase family protein [Noviherbaspirillum sp.]HEV2610296.1 glutathione S-transferase family protein [Noviherbaspirillum sp.]
MRYELYYWPNIQGRGEFVRLALEEADADYVDVARRAESSGMGMPALMRFMEEADVVHVPFAPPYLKAGDLIIGQTANILLFLGTRHGLAPDDEAGRLWTHQLQLTIADLVTEAHDTHHPVGSGLYYREQKPEALRRAADFREARLPKFFDYFETVLECNPDGDAHLVGNMLTYADLSLFQVIAGLRYAFPRAMRQLEPGYPLLVALHDRLAGRPRIKRYLNSARRLPFNNDDVFRHYKELDA